MKSLEEYLKKREAELEKIRKEVGLLRSAKMPLKIREYSNGIGLISEDYSLAEDFEIKKRRIDLGGTSGYDGGYNSGRYESYPRFYFNLEFEGLVEPVYIEHEGFEKDERIVIRSVTVTHGTKEYSSMNSTNENFVDVRKTFNFFRERGVKPVLLDRLAKRIKEAEEF
ncbi:Uncharacterised protein [uncultured archaeon]|nr:Uncharacterised protein [uncultured archaeon]